MIAELLLQGLELLLLGMGIVFGFLTLLVFALRGMSGLADRLAPIADQPIDRPVQTGTPDDPRVVAVIGAAIARYRQGHR